MTLLEELDFSLDLPQDEIIQSKTDVVLTSPAQTHSYANNNIIRLTMNGSGFLDPHSVAMYGDIWFSITTGTQLTSATRGLVPTMYQLVENIRILDGYGNVLEEISEAGLLATLLHNASSNSDYLDCTGGFSNSQKDPSKRAVPVTEGTAIRFRLNITDIMGLFHQPKLLHLPTFKGFTLEMRLTSPANAGAFKAGEGGGFSYTLKNVKLHYTEVMCTQAYMDAYNAKLREGGYALSFPTYQHISNNIAAAGQSQIQLSKTASKGKAIVSVLRVAANRNNLEANSFVGSPNVSSYQYQIGGQLFPPQPIESKSEAFHHLLQANYNRKDNRHSNICYDDFNTAWSHPANITDVRVQNGTYAMWIDLEKSQNSPLSGVHMDGSSTFLKLNQSEGTPVIVDSFVNFERLVSVTNERITYMD